MKKILSMILCVMLLASLAVMANAEAYNIAGGCKTEVTVKKADPSVVEKDGIISDGEYTEVDINRDPTTTDMLFSWDPDASLYASCEEFLKNVHFYFSWDEVNGLNMAIKATLLETPSCTVEQPADNAMNDGDGNTFPGDEFLFQFGAMFSVDDKDGDIVIYRGLGMNTDTNTPLEGHYGRHGYTGSYKLKRGENYNVAINGNTVTYEISYPLAAVLTADNINGNAPVEGAAIDCNLTATGGSQGSFHDGSSTYAVSLGDGGFMTSRSAGTDLKAAKAIFTNDPIVEGPVTTDTTAVDTTSADTTSADTTNNDGTTAVGQTTTQPITPATTRIETSVVESEVVVTDDEGNAVTDEAGEVVTEIVTEVITSIVTDAPTESAGQGTSSPVTGDPMIIAAVVAAISACGVVVAKKRK